MNMYSSATKQSKILPLTSLRFFASLYVVLYHTMARVFVHSRDLSTLHGRILDLGYIAVSFFFTLSGYILAVSLFTSSDTQATILVGSIFAYLPDIPPLVVGRCSSILVRCCKAGWLSRSLPGCAHENCRQHAYDPGVAAVDEKCRLAELVAVCRGILLSFVSVPDRGCCEDETSTIDHRRSLELCRRHGRSYYGHAYTCFTRCP